MPIHSRVLKAEQSNTSILYDNTFFLKLYRRVEAGINPDVELSRHLTEHTRFTHSPAFGGSIEWYRGQSSPMTLAMLQQFVPNQGDAWSYTLDSMDRSFGHALTLKDKLEALPELPTSILHVDPESVPVAVCDFIGPHYVEMVALLGQRTAELHRALLSLSQSREVTPEPFSLLYQKSLYQSIRGLVLRVFRELENNLNSLDPSTGEAVQRILGARKTILARVQRIIDKKIPAMKIRTQGDYHLGQVLYTGKDFVIIDFEGEPARPLTERRLKQPALRDIAGMLRSFHYAAHGNVLMRAAKQGIDIEYLKGWADVWNAYVSGIFLNAYSKAVADTRIVPSDEKDFATLLETFLLEKVVYELGYELNNRPDWLMIPIRGIEQMLQ